MMRHAPLPRALFEAAVDICGPDIAQELRDWDDVQRELNFERATNHGVPSYLLLQDDPTEVF